MKKIFILTLFTILHYNANSQNLGWSPYYVDSSQMWIPMSNNILNNIAERDSLYVLAEICPNIDDTIQAITFGFNVNITIPNLYFNVVRRNLTNNYIVWDSIVSVTINDTLTSTNISSSIPMSQPWSNSYEMVTYKTMFNLPTDINKIELMILPNSNQCLNVAIDYVDMTEVDAYLTVENTESESDFFNLFPNPFSDNINLVLNKKFNNAYYSINDITGKIIIQEKINNLNNIIHTNNLKQGIYIVNLNIDGVTYVKKIIKY